MIALIVIGILLLSLITLWVLMALANSGKSRDARKGLWS